MAPKSTRKKKAPRRTREETQADLQKAALDLLDQRGPLAGLSLSEVADLADVNRVQIYQYFGSREALLRAAISEMLTTTEPGRKELRKLPFIERRMAMFDHFLKQPKVAALDSLLAQDADDEFHAFPEINFAIESLNRDKEEGYLPEEADGIAAHIITSVAYKGYCIYRACAARDTGIPLEELDERVKNVFKKMLQGVASPTTPEQKP